MPPRHLAVLLASPDDVEQQFYDALNEADLDKLMALWAEDDDIVCVHPGGVRVVGEAAVRVTFEALLAQGPLPVRPESVRRLQSLGCAIHSVTERIEVRDATGAAQVGWALATNVYVKTAQGWRLAAHHASPAGVQNEAASLVSDSPSVLH